MPQIRGINIPKESNLTNLIVNGAMEISQRGTSFAAIADAAYSLDRYQYSKVGAAVHTASQDTDVPTIGSAGYLFQNSLRLNLTTPDTAIAAGDFVWIGQKIEGFHFEKIAQKTFTLSFWVKATLTGTYCVSFQNSAADRSYVAEYTISSSNTWELKTIVVPASPSSGTWNYTTGVGLRVQFILAAGTTFQTTAGAWQTGNFYATSNQVNGVNTGATDFRVTGVMINEGPIAAPFKLFSENSTTELLTCERYYEKSYLYADAPATNTATNRMCCTVIGRLGTGVGLAPAFRTEKRTAPSMSIWNNNGTSNTVTWVDSGAGGSADQAATVGSISTKVYAVSKDTATNGVVYIGFYHFIASAEL